jgi:hypothetical protein
VRALQRNRRAEAYATVAANGTATAIIPVTVGPSWEIKQISVSVTGSTLETTAATYVGTNAAGVLISSTIVGNGDTDSEPNTTIRSGESLCCVWDTGTPGARCKLTVVFDEVAY